MHPDLPTLRQRIRDHQALPGTRPDPGIVKPPAVDWTPRLSYPPGQRSQGICGNCWVWAATTACEASLAASGVRDALSVQYFMSRNRDPYPCCGGTLADFAGFYEMERRFVALGNPGAAFQDAGQDCRSGASTVPESGIDPAVQYACSALSPQRVPTLDVEPAAAVAAIKNLLERGKAVLWSFYLPDEAAYGAFVAFWSGLAEKDPWRPGWTSGAPYRDGGSHMVALVGYDDTDPDPARHVWIAQNSWGVTGLRPKGQFRAGQDLDYRGFFTDPRDGARLPMHVFEILDLAWDPPGSTGGQPKSFPD